MISKQVWIAAASEFLGPDLRSCAFQGTKLSSTVTDVHYLWSTGESTADITVDQDGVYWLQLEKNGCTIRDTIRLEKILPPAFDLGTDAVLCAGKPLLIDAGISGVNYRWNTGDSSRILAVSTPGTYRLTVQQLSGGCSAEDSITVRWGDCEPALPTAFSPNGDGVNETFGLAGGIQASNFSMTIYNRNGQVIFQTHNQFDRWDGNMRGKPVSTGVYPWVIRYNNKNGIRQVETGTVVLIR